MLRCILLMLLLSTAVQAAPDAVVLVRHADRGDAPADDPALSAAGAERAEQLAVALQDAGITTVLVTQFRRSRDTAAPLAAKLGLTPQVVTAGGDTEAHVAAVAAAVRAGEGTLLVVGHSNTVNAIIAQLGGPSLPPLCETSFSQVFVLTGLNTTPRLQRWRYGAADAPAASGCL